MARRSAAYRRFLRRSQEAGLPASLMQVQVGSKLQHHFAQCTHYAPSARGSGAGAKGDKSANVPHYA